jgi:hypothetical protein
MMVGCSSDPQVELLLEVGIARSSSTMFMCDDATEVAVTANQADTVRQCLGLGCGGQYEAGSADCQDPTKNPAAGTCVETYFACLAPGGACTGDANEPWRYANGARGEVDLGGDTRMYGPEAGSDPCVVRAKSGFGAEEEHTYVRPF